MPSEPDSHVHADYTVAWISALPLELTAATTMLDEVHPRLPQPLSDTNAYILGSVLGHNVIMTCLPSGSIGTNSAAAVVSNMRSTFPQIQYGLMVGIGGGAPSDKNDIRLGDIVVSVPTGAYGGVVQYDFGKAIARGEIEHTGMLNRPPEVLLSGVSKLQAEYKREGNPILSMLEERSDMNDLAGTYRFPGLEQDRLFEAKYEHVQSKEICGLCDVGRIKQRSPRKSHEPEIHYGLIASGNQLIKNGVTREMLAKRFGFLCFEMEAAGLMNQLPSLVIRGICDYADSHKHDKWQGYAAMTAASYARLLLSILPLVVPVRVAEQSKAYQGLFLTDPEDEMNSLKRRKGSRAPGTCEWLLETQDMLRWLNSKPSETDIWNFCWLYGNPGTGKSTMAITLAEKLARHDLFIDGNARLAYFFCDSSNEVQRTAIAVLRGLLYHLIKNSPSLIDFVMPKYHARREKLFTSFDALWAILLMIGRESGQAIYCIIDGLDECDVESQTTLMGQFNASFQGHKSPDLHILVTSRPYEEIRRSLCDYPSYNLSSYQRVQDDLATMIESRVDELSRRNRYPYRVRRKVSAILKERAEGTFLWVGIACDELKHTRAKDAVQTLRRLPKSLNSVYQKMLDTALDQSSEDTVVIKRILSFVAVARRPLSTLELADACQLYECQDRDYQLAFLHDDIHACRLSIILDDGVVFLLHKSVKNFLLNDQNNRIIDEISAHADLAYCCIDRILSSYKANRWGGDVHDATDFLQYSAEYWPEHAHEAESCFTIQRNQVEFFELRSPSRDWWLDYMRSLYMFDLSHEVPFNFSIFHVAARWGIPCLISYVLSQQEAFNLEQREIISESLSHEYLSTISSDGRTPLDESASAGHLEVFTLLLEKGVFPDSGNASKETLLWQAAYRGYHSVVRVLLESARVEVDALSVDRISPLMAAAAGEHTGIVQMLLQAGADPLFVSAKGETAYSLTPEANLRIRNLVREYGAS
ncbi:purine and uridine phosphorylase [Aspergillus steynii IBT 23096]|uniref:Purine and uridine phosphorylase n=1 Tax=Aspergillus steynii IBT 23096 TaxID=1392250 RepID=A0A2I2GDH5_9EURO|nr:purine and uridine phosphorylase [Aspergillus steynii IBT 23096]PLB50891.1 purine and uridine phosphorylase [Aspergillus steynii IBT 23096]